MEPAHQRLREATDELVRSEAVLRSLSALARGIRDVETEKMEWHLDKISRGITELILVLPHWIECVPEKAMTPRLLDELDLLTSLNMANRLEEIEKRAYEDDLALTSPAIVTLGTEFKIWLAGFKAGLQDRAYFDAFSPQC